MLDLCLDLLSEQREGVRGTERWLLGGDNTSDLSEHFRGVTDFLDGLRGETPPKDFKGVVRDPLIVLTGVLKTKKSALLGVLKICWGKISDFSVSDLSFLSGVSSDGSVRFSSSLFFKTSGSTDPSRSSRPERDRGTS